MAEKQNIDTPHERRPFKDHGHMDVVTVGDFTLGRGVFEPGWRWSDDVKPIAGTDSCQTHHTGICLSGQMTVRLDDGQEITNVALAPGNIGKPGAGLMPVRGPSNVQCDRTKVI